MLIFHFIITAISSLLTFERTAVIMRIRYIMGSFQQNSCSPSHNVL